MTAPASKYGQPLRFVTEVIGPVHAGAPLRVCVSVEGPGGASLVGRPVRLQRAGTTLAQACLMPGACVNEDVLFADLCASAPDTPGDHEYELCVDGVTPDDKASAPRRTLRVDVLPPRIQLLLWAIPSSIPCGEPFRLQAGAKSSAGTRLAGRRLGIFDSAGQLQATATLHDQPLADTASVYWTALELVAPKQLEGCHYSLRMLDAQGGLEPGACARDFEISVCARAS